MARPANEHPTDRELEILHVLWEQGPTSLSVICRKLREDREVAITTVATILRIMREKGIVERHGAARTARWSALITHETAARGLVGKLVEHLFDGSADRLVTHLVEEGELSDDQLNGLCDLMDQHTKRKRNTKRKTGSRLK